VEKCQKIASGKSKTSFLLEIVNVKVPFSNLIGSTAAVFRILLLSSESDRHITLVRFIRKPLKPAKETIVAFEVVTGHNSRTDRARAVVLGRGHIFQGGRQ